MTHRKTFKLLILASLFSGMLGCATHYYYQPEVNGPGVSLGDKGGIQYLIPPTGKTEFSIRIRPLGIRTAHQAQMLGIRIYFVRGSLALEHKKGTTESINPADLIVKLENGTSIHPTYVRSKIKNKPVISLTGADYDVIELLYPLPASIKTAKDLNIFFFHWKMHYGIGKTVEQIASFDRTTSEPAGPEEPSAANEMGYPFGVYPYDAAGWNIDADPFWWPYAFPY